MSLIPIHKRISLFLLLLTGAGLPLGLFAQTATVCNGDQVCLTAGSHRGDLQWQESPDMISWTDLSGATSDTFCVTVTADMHFRAEITEGTCDPIYSDTQSVVVSTLQAHAGADTAVCANSAYTLGGSPAATGGTAPYSWLWTPAPNVGSDTMANPVTVITVPLNYVLAVTDSLGCMAMDTVFVDTGGTATTGADTFAYTGNVQIFVVPPCVDSITAAVAGAQGGSNSATNTNYGGLVTGTFAVSEGDTLYIYVGEQPSGLSGGWNGGGNGETGGAGGGGASDIRMGGQALTDRIIVGGGAGGGGFWSGLEVVGGVGGGLTGGNGYRDTPSTEGGDGATQTASGDGTCSTFNNPICAGGFGYGGSPSNCGCEGYGGGGGWYGGAGSGNCRGGGGGSGYTAPGVSNVSHNSGVQIGHGQIIVSW